MEQIHRERERRSTIPIVQLATLQFKSGIQSTSIPVYIVVPFSGGRIITPFNKNRN